MKEGISLTEYIILCIIVIIIYIGAIIKDKLTIGGANLALIIGIIMSLAGNEYLIIMFAFFYSSIKATSFNKLIKKRLLGAKNYKKDSKRNGFQVFAKGFVPTIISLIIYFKYNGKLMLFNDNIPYKLKFLYGSFIGFFVSANADTWASELGISSRNNPVLITTFKTVPKGVNGGITLYGTIMSIFGGMFISLISIICSIIRMKFFEINLNYDTQIYYKIIIILLIGAICGFLGSTIDSILGATLQISIYDNNEKVIINKDQLSSIPYNNKKYDIYGKDILSNSQINLIAGIITSLITGIIIMYLL